MSRKRGGMCLSRFLLIWKEDTMLWAGCAYKRHPLRSRRRRARMMETGGDTENNE